MNNTEVKGIANFLHLTKWFLRAKLHSNEKFLLLVHQEVLLSTVASQRALFLVQMST